MAEAKNNEPKIIHVDKLIIYADEVIVKQSGQASASSDSVRAHVSEPHINREILGFPKLGNETVPIHVVDQRTK